MGIISNEIRFDESTLRADRREELIAWVKSLGIDPASVRPVGVIVLAEQEYELHLSRFIRSDAGRIRIDRASEQPVTEPLIVPLGQSMNWPSWLSGSKAGDVTVTSVPGEGDAVARVLREMQRRGHLRLGTDS